MEKRGSGLGKIIKETSILPTFKEDRQPYFESSRNFFYTTIPNVNYGMDRTALESFANSKQTEPIFRPEDEIRPAEILINDEKTAQKNHPESVKTAQKKVGKTAQNIIDILVGNPHCTRLELCELLGKSDGTIKEHLAKLQKIGIIQRVGSDRSGHWKVLICK